MKSIRLVITACLTAVLLSGCFATGGSRYGYGSSENATMLGGGGAILGAALTRSNPAVGMVVGGLGGYYVGRQMDDNQNAQGRTYCRARIVREYNRDGSINHVRQNTETCDSEASSRNYRDGYNR